MANELQAWCNGYAVVAARDTAEAAAVLRKKYLDENWFSESDVDDAVDGDGWSAIEPSKQILDEDGTPIGQTFADAVAESADARFMWEVEQ